MSDNSRIIKNSLILYIRLIIVSIVSLASSIYIIRALGTTDFGLYNVVGGIVFMMAFLNTVMVSTTYRYIAFELGAGNDDGVNIVFNTSLVIHFFLAFMVVLIGETIGVYYINNYLRVEHGKLNDALFVFHFSILSTFISIMGIPYQGLITAKEKFFVIFLVDVVRSITVLGSVLLVLFYHGDRLKLYAILMTTVAFLPAASYFLYSHFRYNPLMKWNFQKDKNRYKGMIAYSGWIMFGASASVAEVEGAAVLLNSFFGTILNASFGIAGQVNNLVKMFSQSLNQAVIPQITKSYSSGNTERSMELAIFSSKYSFLLMLLPALPIFLETDFILKLWLKEIPPYTAVFIQLMIINALIATSNAGIPALVQATGKIKYFQIIISSIVLTGLPLSYILFKKGFPPYIMVLCYTLIATVNLFVRQILLKKIIYFDVKEFFYKGYLKMIVVVVATMPLFLIRNIFKSNIFRFTGITALSVVWLLIAVYFLGMEKNERDIVKLSLTKMIRNLFKAA